MISLTAEITPQERLNAEMYYLSRIAKEASDAGEADEGKVFARHKRYDALCDGIDPHLARRLH